MSFESQRGRPRTQPPGFALYLFAAAVVLICLQLIIYLLLLQDTMGPFALFGRQPAPDPAVSRPLRVVLVQSEPTARLWAREGEQGRREARWLRVGRQASITIQAVSADRLGPALGGATVLVLPSVACLADDTRAQVVSFLREGKGVVATGPVGTRDATCTWRGFEYLRDLTGAREAAAVSTGPSYVSFMGERFFSGRLGAGTRLSLPPQDLTVLKTGAPDAFWADWMLRPAVGTSLGDATLAMHAHVAGRGRLVWMGFDERLGSESPVEQTLLEDYLADALRWAGRQPIATVASWPEGKSSAALLATEVQDAAGAENTARVLREEGVPGNFYASAEIARTNPDLLRTLRDAGEIGSSGDRREPVVGEPPQSVATRLARARTDIEAVVGSGVAGFAPPHGLTNAATSTALNQAGFTYYLNEMGVARAVPDAVSFPRSLLFPLQKSEVVRFYRTASDDLDVLSAEGTGDPADAFLADFHRLHAIGGVYTLHFRSDLLGATEHLDSLRRVVREIRAAPTWLAPGRDLARWWASRNRVEVTVSTVSTHRLRLDVANVGQEAIDGVSVLVYLPFHPQRVQFRSTVFRLRTPKFGLEGEDVLRVDCPRLGAQTSSTYVIALDE